MSPRLLTATLTVFMLLSCLPATAEEENWQSYRYDEFKHAKCYRVVDAGIFLAGTAETLFTEDEIKIKLMLALKKELGDFPVCKGSTKPTELGIMIKIWTIGDYYPITCQVELETIWPEGRALNLSLRYQTTMLGYNDKEILTTGGIDRYMKSVAGSFAHDFFRAREEI